MILYFIWFIFFLTKANAANYYVATSYGKDTNSGTFLAITIQNHFQGCQIFMSAGDNCYIGQGRYHGTITINNLDGSLGSPIVFTNYNNERVFIDGTTEITTA